MRGRIQQMQITFVPAQDRLLFRFNTSADEEFRLWFTRRYVKRLWPALLQLLEKTEPLPAAYARPAQGTLRAFQHEQALAQADLATPYREQAEARHPLGAEPVLVSRLQIKETGNGGKLLCLHPETGQGLEIVVDARLVHYLCKLIAEGVKQSDWDLRYALADTAPPPDKAKFN